MKPNPKNFCGGNFQDWLEVMLTGKCNGKCSWCVERGGFKPKDPYITPHQLATAIIETQKKHIILLGGEPTLYGNMRELLEYLVEAKKKVYITTNGSKLEPYYAEFDLKGVTGVNISIHSFPLEKNEEITGVKISGHGLAHAIERLKKRGVGIRFNCNIIRGYTDDLLKVAEYLKLAKRFGADKVRFAELKNDTKNFVGLEEIFGPNFGLNNNPFVDGCNHDAVIGDMPVNFRQMCGLQIPLRPRPDNPELAAKKVLYYDGKIYDGWQTQVVHDLEEKEEVGKNTLRTLLSDLQRGKRTAEETAQLIEELYRLSSIEPLEKAIEEIKNKFGFSGGCQY